MTQHFQAFGILVGDDGQARVAIDRERRVDELAVDLARERGLGQARPNRGGDLGHGDRRVEVLDRAVG